jgi:hypothetical protein
MKYWTRVALGFFAFTVIVHEPKAIETLLEVALKSFGKEAAKIDKKMSKPSKSD